MTEKQIETYKKWKRVEESIDTVRIEVRKMLMHLYKSNSHGVDLYGDWNNIIATMAQDIETLFQNIKSEIDNQIKKI